MLARSICGDAAVREFLPALVQAGGEGARRREGERSAIIRQPRPVSGCWRTRGRGETVRRRVDSAARYAGSGSSAERDPRGPAAAGRDRRHAGSRRAAHLPRRRSSSSSRAAHGMAGGRGAPDQHAKGEGQALAASASDPFAAVTSSCAAGSRRSRGGRRANCSSGCRRSIPASTRTGSCGHSSVGSKDGGGKRRTSWCSGPRQRRLRQCRCLTAQRYVTEVRRA